MVQNKSVVIESVAYSGIQIRFYAVRPILLIMIVECFTWQALTCEWHKCKSVLAHANVIISCISRDVFFGSALPHRSSLRNLTLVVGQHYLQKTFFLQNVDALATQDAQHKMALRGMNTKLFLFSISLEKKWSLATNFIVNCKLYQTSCAFCALRSNFSCCTCHWGTWV